MDTGTVISTGTPLTWRNVLIVSGLSLLYLSASAWLLGYKNDQRCSLVLLFNALFYLSGPTRRFILGFTVFLSFFGCCSISHEGFPQLPVTP